MTSPTDALQAAQHRARVPADPRQRVLVVGGGGTLGSALLEQALAGERFAQVAAVVAAPLLVAMRGLRSVTTSTLAHSGADLAFIVFERARHASGRDETFLRPQVDDLAALARALRDAGIRRLVVVVPHAPALLPQALKLGLASLDEATVAALGFDQLVFVRAASGGLRGQEGGRLRRFAGWWLSQLAWMVPQQDQPLRTARLAEIVVMLGLRLAQAASGTRVLAPETLWAAAQGGNPGPALDAWLASR